MESNIKKDLASSWFRLLQESFCDDINKLENSDTDYILLIDNDLRHKEYTGLQFITQRSIESKSILVTSSGNSNWLHSECSKSKLPIVPKSILERIPVQILI